VLYSAESVVSGRKIVNFGVLRGAVQYRDCCEWVRTCLLLVYLWVLYSAEIVVCGWENISFGVLKGVV
jgi:hypothetical protein